MGFFTCALEVRPSPIISPRLRGCREGTALLVGSAERADTGCSVAVRLCVPACVCVLCAWRGNAADRGLLVEGRLSSQTQYSVGPRRTAYGFQDANGGPRLCDRYLRQEQNRPKRVRFHCPRHRLPFHLSRFTRRHRPLHLLYLLTCFRRSSLAFPTIRRFDERLLSHSLSIEFVTTVVPILFGS